MIENERRRKHEDIECVQEGLANGVAKGFPLSEDEKAKMIDEAEIAFGHF